MAQGQRLRWWQEQEEQSQVSERASEQVAVAAAPVRSPTVATTAAEPVTLAEEYSDTWEDLETEALRRAEQAKKEEAESISFLLNKSNALACHRRAGRFLGWGAGGFLLLLIMIPLALLITDSQHHHSPPPFGIICCFASFFTIYYQRLKWLEDTDKPTVRIAPQGIFIDSPTHRDAALPWDEIVEIKTKGSQKKRCLEIRATKRRRFVIEERDLPISAEALAARIAIYETGRGMV